MMTAQEIARIVSTLQITEEDLALLARKRAIDKHGFGKFEVTITDGQMVIYGGETYIKKDFPKLITLLTKPS